MWVHDLRDADATCGGKAVGLARLVAAGLPVPAGFVISDAAFRSVVGSIGLGTDIAALGHTLGAAADAIAAAPIPEALEREVNERAGLLGPLVAVRSSATIEDGAAGAAAGVFSSRTGVTPAGVWDAIRAVWTSALTPLAAAYARKRGGEIAIGVIVQQFAEGDAVVVYTRPPGKPDAAEILIQRAGDVTRAGRDGTDEIARLALRAEGALACPAGVDVELVAGSRTVIVQARPIVHPVPRALLPPPPALLGALHDGRTWHWDVAHNPDPLSLAQQGLVERVEAAGIAPWSLRVCGGFLYAASRGEPPPEPPRSADELAMRGVELEARCDRTLHVEGTPSVTEAIERYLAFYAIWARELSPLIRVARGVLPEALRRRGVERPEETAARLLGPRASAVEACLFAAARGEIEEADVERHLGCLSPAWDVCVATYAERPGVIRDAIARARGALAMVESPPEAAATIPIESKLRTEIEIAPLAADLAERDDALFARAQWLVRRAVLAHARALGITDDDAFWVPLGELAVTTSAASIDPVDARRRASGARAAAERAAKWRMPIIVGGGDPIPAAGPAENASLRGAGSGARVTGRVVRFASLASAIAVGPGDVVVARSITPALAVLVAGCAALVSETGGYLDHGAALARELGIPCVVGCRDAWSSLADGIVVTVDGDAGTVTPT